MITYKQFNLSDCLNSLIVADEYVARLYGIAGDNVYLLPRGEQAKTFAETENLCKWFLSKNLGRNGRVVAVGGGSVGDVTGFACSIYKRGNVNLTHVPTTLIAQIDSAVGGKTAVNLDGVKNAVGTFFDADTLIDIGFLQTLDNRQILSGCGELLKYRMLCTNIDKVYCGKITEDVIRACVDYKLSLCQVDMYDLSSRRALNFGHTVGHAMELSCNLPHGIAVANGLYYETLLAHKLGMCSKAYFTKWSAEAAKLTDILPVNKEILKLVTADKKNIGNLICFVLPNDFRQTILSLEQVISLLCCG